MAPLGKFGFRRWNFQFEIDGETTLDPEKEAKLIRRIAGRQKLFMDPLIRSGFLENKRVLDLGSNSGYWSLLALRDGKAASVTGLDASPELVEQANFVFEKHQQPRGRYDFRVADAYRFLETTDETFDVILCLGFFYHINDPLRLLKLMAKRTSAFVVIDTVIHKSEGALISLRPVVKRPDSFDPDANITLEFVSSQKAIFWMAEETGYKQTRLLTDDYEKISSMWGYRTGRRQAYVLSKGPDIAAVWPNAKDPGYLTIQEDLKKYGYFPEDKQGRPEEKAAGAQSPVRQAAGKLRKSGEQGAPGALSPLRRAVRKLRGK
jgi:SAM-dependent methyltransferase